MKKIYFLILFLLLLSISFASVYADSNININVIINGQQVSITDSSLNFLDSNRANMDNEIINFTANQVVDMYASTESYKQGVSDIAKTYGYDVVTVNIDSDLNDGSLPLVSAVKGTSMTPTLHSGDIIIINRTQEIKTGDVVVCNDTEYGLIVKRVGEVNGANVYLQSDNKSKELINDGGFFYVEEGLHKWVTLDRIYGVVKYDLTENSTS
ncbi:MAG: S24 family peptidase [Methanobacteriaceae archaeon]|nr:S24 family peptidase [Methanobacteriaceae archaeon]MDD4593787.1 S24 family peptidase [Methanobacteriaceae archaeon]